MVSDISFSLFINNKEVKFIILDKFNKENKNFIIYKEIDKDDIYASFYEIKNEKLKLIPIEEDHDFDLVDSYLGAL